MTRLMTRSFRPTRSLARTAVLSALVPTLAALGACDPLASPDYPGEAMLTLQGEVTSALESGGSADGSRVAIVWVAGEASGQKIPIADSAEIQGEFPASFTLNVYHPPEEPSLVTLDSGSRLGLGFIVALPESAALGDAVDLEQMTGISNRHVVVYVPTDADIEGTASVDRRLRNASVGFNLIDLTVTSEEYETCRTDTVAAIDACNADCTANCDPDSAEDPGCNLCREPCQALSEEFWACDDLISLVVPASTDVELLFDPAAVAESAVWTVFNADADEEASDDT